MPEARTHRGRSAPGPLRRSLRALLLTVILTGTVPLAVATLATVAPPASAARAPLPTNPPTPSTAAALRRTLTQPSSATAVTTQAGPLSLLGLGDSVTSGANCDCTPFVDQLASLLAHRDHVPVSPVNLGVSGLTAADLASQLGDDPAMRLAVQGADLIVMTIGANDLQPALDRWDQTGTLSPTGPGCAGNNEATSLAQVGADLSRILDQLTALRAGRPTRVLVTAYWNVFEDGHVAAADRGADYLRWSDKLTRCLNDQISTAAHEHGAVTVDLYTPFKGNGDQDPTALLADDGDHPDAAGHALIARALLGALATGEG